MATVKEHTEVRQQQIIDAARKLIFNNGSEFLTVKNIAAEVGISEGAIYKHFKSKKSILTFLLDHIERALLADIAQVKSATTYVTLEVIEKAVDRHFSVYDLHKGISFQVIAEIISLGDKDLNTRAALTVERYISSLKDLHAEGMDRGSIRRDIDPEAAATLLFGLIQGLVSIWTLRNGSFDLNTKFTELWHIYKEAILPRGEKTSSKRAGTIE